MRYPSGSPSSRRFVLVVVVVVVLLLLVLAGVVTPNPCALARRAQKMSAEDFVKKYAYNIRHNYGKEGRRKDYRPYNCTRILLGNPPGAGDYRGTWRVVVARRQPVSLSCCDCCRVPVPPLAATPPAQCSDQDAGEAGSWASSC